MRTPRHLIGTVTTLLALMLVPASAHAAISLSGSTAKPTDTSAGAHSDFKIHVAIAGDDIKDLTISLPPGEVGNPTATPELCAPSQLPNCPGDTAVGTVKSTVTALGLPLPQLNGTVFNLVPQPGEPARFGIVLNALPVSLPAPFNSLLLPPTVVQSGASLRQSDLGLDTVVNDIPKSAVLVNLLGVPVSAPIHITSMDLSLDGKIPGSGNAFMRNPTSCKTHTVGFAADSYQGTSTTAQDQFTTTNCGALDFSPAFTAEVGGAGQTTNGVPTTASTAILQDPDEAGLHDAVVTVPSDLNPNATLFFGAHCDQASFVAGTCPSNTVVGLATASSPLLSTPLVGNVELVSGPGPFPNLGLDLRGQLHLLLQGASAITISRFQLTFTNPPALLGTSRDLCTPPAPLFHASFSGYNGANTSVDAPATVDGCGAGSGAGNVSGKCKAKKKKKHRHHRAAESKKKHKKRSCKKKKRKHHRK
jgi:hypothetical protein